VTRAASNPTLCPSVLLGPLIQFQRILHEPLVVLLTLGLALGSRFVAAYLGLPLLGIRQPAWMRVVMLAGIRGALPRCEALLLAAQRAVP
jgi:hypothetical protein